MLCFGIGKVKISLFTVICMAAVLYSDFSVFTFQVILAAAIHEAGHIIAMKHFGVRIFSVYILPCGVIIDSDCTLLPYKKEALTALAGALANILTGMTGFALWLFLRDVYSLFFSVSCLFFAVINLIPVKTFDGARALRAVLLQHCDREKTELVMETVYYFAFLFLVLVSLYVLYLTDGNFSLIILLCSVFIAVYSKEENNNY